ncbi:2052_t:CDS:2 [Dentiscutata erythropus]|uniref:2052_t:CDS:1 n=1 Tax=Dentiscutata erythropus TaxID=1348616 RepID=A0A9N9B4N4_9GLOM|nr:2052_t:CDS:2 [Dentiscutata erythropus]
MPVWINQEQKRINKPEGSKKERVEYHQKLADISNIEETFMVEYCHKDESGFFLSIAFVQ